MTRILHHLASLPVFSSLDNLCITGSGHLFGDGVNKELSL